MSPLSEFSSNNNNNNSNNNDTIEPNSMTQQSTTMDNMCHPPELPAMIPNTTPLSTNNNDTGTTGTSRAIMNNDVSSIVTTTIATTNTDAASANMTSWNTSNKRPREFSDDDNIQEVTTKAILLPMESMATIDATTITTNTSSIVSSENTTTAQTIVSKNKNDKDNINMSEPSSVSYTIQEEIIDTIATVDTTTIQQNGGDVTFNRPMTKRKELKKSFAPDVRVYINQETRRRNDRANNDKKMRSCSSSSSSSRSDLDDNTQHDFPYLPRPEWFGIVNYIIKADIETSTKQIDDEYDNYNNFKNINKYSNNCRTTLGDQIDKHVKHCVASKYVSNSIYLHYTDDSDYDDVDHICFLREGYRTGFETMQLASRILYLDTNEFIWRTQQIQSVCTDDNVHAVTTTKQLDDVMDIDEEINILSPHNNNNCESHPFHITYLAMIERQHHQGLGQRHSHDNNTILHTAILENATMIALDIIRIEYNTFQDCVRRNDALKDQLHLTILEAINNSGYTPIIMAARKGNFIVLQELLRCGVALCPLLPGTNGSTTGSVLLHAAQFGRDKIMEYVIDYYLLNHNVRATVKTLNASWPTTLKNFVDFPSKNGMTPLMVAAQGRHISIVKLLLRHDASIHCKTYIGMTPLMFASRSGSVPICRLLMERGAEIFTVTETRSTALLLACKYGHVDVVKELVVAGCYLHEMDDESWTAEQVVQRRILRRTDLPATNRSTLSIYSSDLGSDHGPGLKKYVNVGPLSNDQKMLFLLNPPTQAELMQYTTRVKRNYEIARLYTLLQQNRADIQLNDGSTSDVLTVVQWFTNSTTSHSSDSNTSILPSMVCPEQDPQLSKLPVKFTRSSSTQMLFRTMLLPAPIVQAIALFLPLPPLWKERIRTLVDWTSSERPNEAVVCALDIIDEILEHTGLLSAFDAAKIPAPNPYRTWSDWKRSVKSSRAEWNDRIQTAIEPPRGMYYRLSICHLQSPSPQDASNPTICELRRMAGYLPLLSQYQSHTDIVTILTEEPYEIEADLIKRLIGIADVASLCRRCCLQPLFSSSESNHLLRCIEFDANIASDIVSLADDLNFWYYIFKAGGRDEDDDDDGIFEHFIPMPIHEE